MTCLIPFDLYRLDGNLRLDSNHSGEPIMDRILTIAKVSKLSDALYLFVLCCIELGFSSLLSYDSYDSYDCLFFFLSSLIC